MYLIAATWKYALPYMAAIQNSVARGLPAEDAAEQIVISVEDDPAELAVGANGLPNSMGEVELDAAFMEGHYLRIGAVASLCGFRNPVRIARRVMVDTPYNLLVGDGASDFALSRGFTREFLLTEEAHRAYTEYLVKKQSPKAEDIPSHDTVGVIVMDTASHFAVAMSTSGRAYKLPGRVSDSVLCGCGFYADDELGAAVATGVGEDIMRGTLCASAMDLLRENFTPQEAANEVIRRLAARLGRKAAQPRENTDIASHTAIGQVAMIVVDAKGNYGFAANHNSFSVCIATHQIEAVNIPVTTPISTIKG